MTSMPYTELDKIDTVFRAIIETNLTPLHLRKKMVEGMFDYYADRVFVESQVIPLCEAMTNFMLESDTEDSCQMAVIVYRHYGVVYRNLYKKFFCPETINQHLSNKKYTINRRLIWLRENVMLLKDDQEGLKNLQPILTDHLMNLFWRGNKDLQQNFDVIAIIYTFAPSLVTPETKEECRNKLISLLEEKASNMEDERRIVVISAPSLIKLYWKNVPLEEYEKLINHIMSKVLEKNCETGSALSLIMPYLPEQLVKKVLEKLCSPNSTCIGGMQYALENLLQWLLRHSAEGKQIALWIKLIIKYLYQNGHGDIPHKLTRSRLSLILTHIPVPSISEGCMIVFESLVVSYRRSAMVFHDIIPLLQDIYSLAQTEPDLKDARRHIDRLVFVVRCLITMFPGYSYFNLYKPLKLIVLGYHFHSQDDVDKFINDHNWENPPKKEEYDFYKNKTVTKKEGYKTFILKAVVKDLNEQNKDIEIIENMVECGEIDFDRCVSSDDEWTTSEESDEKSDWLHRQLLADYSEIANSLKHKLPTPGACCHPNHRSNHDRSMRRKMVDEYLTKIFTWE